MSRNREVISLFPSLWKALIFSQHYELNQADFLAKKSSWNQIIFWSGFELIFSRYLSRFLAHKLRWFSLDFWHIKLADFQRISDPENGVIFKEYLALKTLHLSVFETCMYCVCNVPFDCSVVYSVYLKKKIKKTG